MKTGDIATKANVSLSSITSLISCLSSISSNLPEYQQKILKNVDEVVLNYITNRNLSRLTNLNKNCCDSKTSQFQLQNDTINSNSQPNSSENVNKIDYLTFDGLQVLQSQSQQKILELEKSMAQFYKNRDLMLESNTRIIKDINQIHQFSTIIELCKEIILELSKYKDVQQFSHRLIQYRKKVGNNQASDEFIDQLQIYFKKMGNFVSDSENQDEDEVEFQDQFGGSYKSLSQTKQKQNQDDRNQMNFNSCTPQNTQNNVSNWSSSSFHSKNNTILQLIQ